MPASPMMSSVIRVRAIGAMALIAMAFFAVIREAWLNLPEAEAERHRSPDHLRKWALIRAGYRNELTIACASKAEADRKIGQLKALDDYAVVLARDNLLIVYTAKSQSLKAMSS